MNYLELLLTKQSIMNQLNDLIYSVDKATRKGLKTDDVEFMRSLVLDLNSCKDKILKIYTRGRKHEIR